MTTRKAFARQEVSKLQVALQELKIVKEKYDQLYSEREDNENELLELLNKNKTIKAEMSTLHLQYEMAVEERDQLQVIIDGFDQCSSEYELSLKKISTLEEELCDAHNYITQLEEAAQKYNTRQTLNLYDELIGREHSASAVDSNLPPTIDLTKDSTFVSTSAMGIVKCSRNKLKKYLKLNKYIKKTEKLIKKQYSFKNLIKNRLNLKKQLKLYTIQLDDSRQKYQAETNSLKCQLHGLEESLHMMTSQYNAAQQEIAEHTVAMNDLIDLCNYNTERFESLQNNHACECYISSQSQGVPSPPPAQSVCDRSHAHSSNNVVMYSDGIGKDMGRYLGSCMGQTVINYCMPNASFNDIIMSISKNQAINSKTILIIFIGGRGNLNKNDVLKHYETLSQLKVAQIVMFALPYISNRLSERENTIRYKINMNFHNLSCGNNIFHLIDTNAYVSKCFVTTRGILHISHRFRRQIALSLSYLLDISAKNLAKRTGSIDQYNCSLRNNNLTLINLN